MSKEIINKLRAEWFEQRKTTAFLSFISGKIRAANEILASLKPCVWTKNKKRGWWNTSCDRLANYKEKFCPYCGAEIEEAGE